MRHTKEIIHLVIITSAVGKQRTAYSTSSSLRPMVTELHDGNSVSTIVNSTCFYSKSSEFSYFQLDASEI